MSVCVSTCLCFIMFFAIPSPRRRPGSAPGPSRAAQQSESPAPPPRSRKNWTDWALLLAEGETKAIRRDGWVAGADKQKREKQTRIIRLNDNKWRQ
jgi:hypothetical protein